MRRLFRLFLNWLFGKPLRRLELEAAKYGKLTLTQTGIEIKPGVSVLGWHCLLRGAGESAVEFGAWTSHGATIEEAIRDAIEQAKGNPVDEIAWPECEPKLGGAEHDGDD